MANQQESEEVDINTKMRNFHAKIVYKSGAIQDLLEVTDKTNVFEIMQNSFLEHLSGRGMPYHTIHFPNGSITILWADVSSYYYWVD